MTAWAAILLMIYSLATMISLIVIGGTPETAQQGFDLLGENRLAGLLRLDVLTILFIPLYYLLLLGLYSALRSTDGAKSLLAEILGMAGVTLVLATPSAFSFLTLSDKFAAATGEAQRTALLAAGQALLAMSGAMANFPGTGTYLSYLLIALAGILFASQLLPTHRATAIFGLLAGGCDLAYCLTFALAPSLQVLFMASGGACWMIWHLFIARLFFKPSGA
jgi:hypothetical protein